MSWLLVFTMGTHPLAPVWFLGRRPATHIRAVGAATADAPMCSVQWGSGFFPLAWH